MSVEGLHLAMFGTFIHFFSHNKTTGLRSEVRLSGPGLRHPPGFSAKQPGPRCRPFQGVLQVTDCIGWSRYHSDLRHQELTIKRYAAGQEYYRQQYTPPISTYPCHALCTCCLSIDVSRSDRLVSYGTGNGKDGACKTLLISASALPFNCIATVHITETWSEI